MSVRVQQYENLIKKWASPVSFRVRHFNKFENGIGIRFSVVPASRAVCFFVWQGVVYRCTRRIIMMMYLRVGRLQFIRNRFFGHATSHVRHKLSILYWAFRLLVISNGTSKTYPIDYYK